MYIDNNSKFKLDQKVIVDLKYHKKRRGYRVINYLSGTVVSTAFDTIGVCVNGVNNPASKNGTWWLDENELIVMDEVVNDKNCIQKAIRKLTPGTTIKVKFAQEKLSYEHYLRVNNTNFIILSNNATGIVLFSKEFDNPSNNSGVFKPGNKVIDNFVVVSHPTNKFKVGDVIDGRNGSKYTVNSIKYEESQEYKYYIELINQNKSDRYKQGWLSEAELLEFMDLRKKEKEMKIGSYNFLLEEDMMSLCGNSEEKYEIIFKEENKNNGGNKMENLLESLITKGRRAIEDVLKYKLQKLRIDYDGKIEDIKKETEFNSIVEKHTTALQEDLDKLNNKNGNKFFTVSKVNLVGLNIDYYLNDAEEKLCKRVEEEYIKNEAKMNECFKRIIDSLYLCTTPEGVNEFLKAQGFIDDNGLIISPDQYCENNKK